MDMVHFVLSQSILIAFIIGIVRYRKIDPAYYPFLYYTGAAVLMEILARVFTLYNRPDLHLPSLRIYSLVEFCLFTWLFHNWGLFNRRKAVFFSLLGIFFILWVVSSFIIHTPNEQNFSFLVVYSFALIFFSVNTFNKVVVHERGNIFTNPKFLICLGIIIFYTFFTLVNVTSLSVFKQNVSRSFRINLQQINVYTNFLVNLLYAVAILWIPRKQNFTTPF
jgi:hypothetical protein